MKSTYNVEFAGNQIESKEVIAKAKKVWVDAGNKDRKIKDLKNDGFILKTRRERRILRIQRRRIQSFPLYE